MYLIVKLWDTKGLHSCPLCAKKFYCLQFCLSSSTHLNTTRRSRMHLVLSFMTWTLTRTPLTQPNLTVPPLASFAASAAASSAADGSSPLARPSSKGSWWGKKHPDKSGKQKPEQSWSLTINRIITSTLKLRTCGSWVLIRQSVVLVLWERSFLVKWSIYFLKMFYVMVILTENLKLWVEVK